MTEEHHNPTDPALHLQELFPEAASLFKTSLQPLHAVKDNCVVVLDTNILLIPYTISPKTLEEIGTTYARLVKKKRLVVPAQVAREFARQRTKRIEELFQQLTRRISGLPKLKHGRYPLLEPLPAYRSVVEVEEALDVKQRDYRRALEELLAHVKNWTWNDPVSELYSEAFTDTVVVEVACSEADILAELERRARLKIPPGYKDAGKDDNAAGDLLIWQTILEVGKSRRSHVLFVSGDAKADWWHRSEGQSLYPRFELADEFRRASGGQSFHMVSFSRFLDLFGAQKNIVEEVRQKESETLRSHAHKRFREFRKRGMLAERAVVAWARQRYEAVDIEQNRRGFPDILLADGDGEKVGIEVLLVSQDRPGPWIARLRDIAYRGYYASSQEGLVVFAIALVTTGEAEALKLGAWLDSRSLDLPTTHFHVGYLTPSAEFVDVREIRI